MNKIYTLASTLVLISMLFCACSNSDSKNKIINGGSNIVAYRFTEENGARTIYNDGLTAKEINENCIVIPRGDKVTIFSVNTWPENRPTLELVLLLSKEGTKYIIVNLDFLKRTGTGNCSTSYIDTPIELEGGGNIYIKSECIDTGPGELFPNTTYYISDTLTYKGNTALSDTTLLSATYKP